MTQTLAIATATSQVGVALGDAGAIRASLRLLEGKRHAEVLAPAIDSLTRACGVSLGDLDRIGVDAGPGLFTGLRVGVATAKALGSALGIPVVVSSSLDLLAFPHRLDTGRTVAAVVDARRGEVFWSLYRDGSAVSPAVSTSPLELAEAITSIGPSIGGKVLAAGDGARRYEDVLVAAGAVVAGPSNDHPDPAVLVEVASQGDPVPAAQVEPIYIRAPDVRIGWVERDGGVRA